MLFSDRKDAGVQLAKVLKNYRGKDAYVLALPRGGVPVAYEIAKALDLPLDLLLVRKLGLPCQEELAMGAIALGGIEVFNEDVYDSISVSKEELEQVLQKERKELQRRDEHYRAGQPFPSLENKTVILVDDGVATGATMRAGIMALRACKPAFIVVAVPLAPLSTSYELSREADEWICLENPEPFSSIGQWYTYFEQNTDEEVIDLLRRARRRHLLS